MKISRQSQFSNKHFLIDKANSAILFVAVITVAIVMFSVVTDKMFISQISYQGQVINLRTKANKQLQTNIQSVDVVVNAYESFENARESVIGTTDKNSKIVLDALPSKYDFPAMVTSIGSLVSESGATLQSISGSDAEAQAEQSSTNPQPIEIPFSITATGSLAAVQSVIDKLEHSIRPIKIDSIALSATDSRVQLTVEVKTYYQPAKQLGLAQFVINKNGGFTAKTNGAAK